MMSIDCYSCDVFQTPASVDDSLTDDVFFDTPTPTALRPKSAASGAPLRPFVMHPDQPAATSTPPATGTPEKPWVQLYWKTSILNCTPLTLSTD